MSVCQNIKAVAEAREINIKELSRRVDIPYTTLYSTHCPSDDESTNLRNNEDDKPCKAERTDRFPFKPADKRYRALCDFDTLNSLGQEVIVQLLLSIRTHQFEGDLRREFIFLLKHSNNKAVFQLNQALPELSYIGSFNDQYASSNLTELLENLDTEVD